MDPSRGRRGPLPAARLIAIAALIALLLGLRLFTGGEASAEAGGAAPAAALLAPESAAPAPPAPAPRPPDVLVTAAERAARERAVEGVIARWMAEAQRISKGKAGPGSVQVSLHAVEVGTRSGVLASRRADASLLPASNMKLVTTAVALTLAGPSFEFETRVEAGGPLAGGVLRGDLVVRAAGDPLTDELGTGEVEGRLDALARGLAERGLRRVAGDLVLDEGVFAAPAPAPGWPDASQRWADYCALSGGFTVNGGVLRATVGPGGYAPRVVVHPSPHGLREVYSLRYGERNDVRVGATPAACTVKGELPAAAAATWSASFAHPDPVELFGAVLGASLERAGIAVDGGVVRRRGDPPGPVLATLRSPLSDALVPINTHSTNGVAEQVFLAMGALAVGEGSRAGGAEAGARALESLGVARAGFVQVDGSGLSRDNRATARQIVALLEAVHGTSPEVRDAFFSSLAVAGRTGTLEDRLGGTPAEGLVSAKTGWIEGASALSGLARAPGGREVLFSILVGYPRDAGGLNKQVLKPMQDELVLALFEDSR
jgi:D-alanyl-D-alanine carboxypeptidase/D-alanyl-D-alanine-endopeptidase (penicillin-binding protein 4)